MNCVGAAAMEHTSPALKDFAEAAEFLRGAFSPDFEAIGEVTPLCCATGNTTSGTADMHGLHVAAPRFQLPLQHERDK